jgi:DNA-binding transcriptional LysR family regulator
VADTGSISGAAKRLPVPKSTVSRRVRRLENALGHELLRRSARSVVLTKHGKVLHERTAGSLRELQDAARAIGQANEEPAGTLRLSTVPGLGYSQRFIACLRDYSLRYPKPSSMLSSPPRLLQWVKEGFDIAVRLHTGQLSGTPDLMSRRLFQVPRFLRQPRLPPRNGGSQDLGRA